MNKEKLKEIFEELCKGNSSILDDDNRMFISNMSMYFYNASLTSLELSKDDIEALKYFIMICNVTYNRMDIVMLPVEDGVYDLLNELYKKYDKDFQVGSAVVQFESMVEKSVIDKGKSIAIKPFYKIPVVEKDEIRQDFERQIKQFDIGAIQYRDLFYDIRTTNLDMSISKRTHNTTHNHPSLVGTLDKCKFVFDNDAIEKDVFTDNNVKILERDFFIQHINAGIIRPDQELHMVIELKYDGISVEADCTDEVVSARTRGDTGVGLASDITPMLKGYRFPRNDVLKDREVGVKFEAIMTKSNLYTFNKVRGCEYANCRTAIIGLFGASDANLYRDYITLVPLALDRDNVPEIHNRMEEIELLNRLYMTKGQPLRYVYVTGNYQTCLYLIKKFADEAKCARDYLDFMFDGIVVSYLDEDIRERLGRENYVNKFSMAVKFDPLCKLTQFMGYTYEIGQNGNVCPMIHYAPVEFFGTIHNKSTGSSYGRYMDLGLRYGDVIEVTYTNDVMPYVTKPMCPQNEANTNPIVQFPTECPDCGTKLILSESGKTAICPNIKCKSRMVARMSNMLQKLGIKGFADSTIRQLDVYTFADLMRLTEEQIQFIGPTNAHNLITTINTFRMNEVDDYRLLGSIGFTGIAIQKWKLILSNVRLRDLHNMMMTDDGRIMFTNIMSPINGIGPSVIRTIVEEYQYYMEDIEFILNNMMIKNSIDMANTGSKQIRFTGCRNKELETKLQSMGFDADGNAGVTKSTDILIIPYDGFSSTKVNKVSSDCIVVPISEFMSNMDKYLM